MDIEEKLQLLNDNELDLVINLIDTLSANKTNKIEKAVLPIPNIVKRPTSLTMDTKPKKSIVQENPTTNSMEPRNNYEQNPGVISLNANKVKSNRSGNSSLSRPNSVKKNENNQKNKSRNYGRIENIDTSLDRPNKFFDLQIDGQLIAESSKEDTKIDKLLHNKPNVPRARETNLVTMECKECHDIYENINPILLKKDAKGDIIYICNNCELLKGRN